MNDQPQPLDPLLPLPRVMDLTGLGRTTIYRLIKEGSFPAPFKPGGAASRWSEAEIREWRTRLEEERRSAAA
ncbi:MAG: transcriptional regulator [Stutzerimonas stutzeri]|nr:MAG: transcriptional regulator [Stutzerimonas stutzeri]